jgi:hypothetical protein
MPYANVTFDSLLAVPDLASPPRPAEEFEHRIEQWLLSHGINSDPEARAHLRATRPGFLTLLIDPGMSPRLLELSGLQMAYMFSLDDHLEQTGAEHPANLIPITCELFDVLNGEQPTRDTQWGRGLRELRARMRELAEPAQLWRWAENVRYFLHAVVMEAVQRSTGRPANLPDCQTIRLLSGGCLMWYPLFELACENAPTSAQLGDPDVQRLVRSSANIAAWINDLFSLSYERRLGLPINLALAYQTSYGCELGKAVLLAADHINRETESFTALREKVEASADPVARAYLDGMTGWIAGTFHWSRTAPRYEKFSLAELD